MQLMWGFPEFLQPYLCEVLQPWWDPDRNASGPAEGRRGDGSRVTSVLWSWNGTGLVHDNRWLAWIVVHVEAWRRGLRVSVPSRARRVRSHHVAAVLSHGVRCLVGRAWITWKTHTGIKSVSVVPSIPVPATSNFPSSLFGVTFKLHRTNTLTF